MNRKKAVCFVLYVLIALVVESPFSDWTRSAAALTKETNGFTSGLRPGKTTRSLKRRDGSSKPTSFTPIPTP